MGGTLVTYGETMLRLNPADAGERLVDATGFTARAGGSESNVAVALARLGMRSRHLTRLPAGSLGDRVVGELAAAGVDVSGIARGGSRVGLYWTETGSGPRPSTVLYDREGSAFAEGWASDYPSSVWDDAAGLHVSGITSALSAHCATELVKLVDSRPEGVKFSLDLNYRSALWRWVADEDTTVAEVMWDLASRADVLFANETDLRDCLGLDIDDESTPEQLDRAVQEVYRRLPRLAHLALSHRESLSASENRFGGMLFTRTDGGISAESAAPRTVVPVTDRFGTGDAFAAGVIDGLLGGRGPGAAVEFGVALAALCHTVSGDHSRFSRADVERCVADASGRVVR